MPDVKWPGEGQIVGIGVSWPRELENIPAFHCGNLLFPNEYSPGAAGLVVLHRSIESQRYWKRLTNKAYHMLNEAPVLQ